MAAMPMASDQEVLTVDGGKSPERQDACVKIALQNDRGGNMTVPDEKRKGSPRERFRNILSAEEEAERAREPRKPAVVNLPRIGERGMQAAGESASSDHVEPLSTGAYSGSRFLRIFWTVGGILSILANIVLLSMLAGGTGSSLPAGADGVLAGVYSSLEQLDSAHIRTTIPLQTSLAMDATVPIKTSTRITLARDLFVRGAHVTINASGLSIDSPADITLPAGTEMDVNLDLALPLQTNLPISADVPVNIAVRDTELHAAIQGLKDSLRPLVCANSPRATLSDGTPICR
jgi:hypothetical protein